MSQAKLDQKAVKSKSEKIILEAGGSISDSLPDLDYSSIRPREAIVSRALILNALLQIAFNNPTEFVETWLEDKELLERLTPWESSVLARNNHELSEEEINRLFSYMESLWALLWVGSMVDDLCFEFPVGESCSSLCPNLKIHEDGSKLWNKMKLRDFDEVFAMLDLYYRLHWSARDAESNDYDSVVDADIVIERRRALEWALSGCGWDEVELRL